jgi:hypothetical protein
MFPISSMHVKLRLCLVLVLLALCLSSGLAQAQASSKADAPVTSLRGQTVYAEQDDGLYRTYLPFFAFGNPPPPPGPVNVLIDDFEYDDSPLLHHWFILDPEGDLSTVLYKFDSRRLLAAGDFSFTYPGDPSSGQALNVSLPFLSFGGSDSDGFWFSVDVVGTDGRAYVLRYQPDFSPLTLTRSDGQTTIHYGLGAGLVDNQWHNIRRNLAVDLARAVSGVSVHTVQRLTFHGLRFMNDIMLGQPPVTGDVYPPHVEIQLDGTPDPGGIGYVSPVRVKFMADDGAQGSGIEAVFVRIDGFSWIQHLRPISVFDEPGHHVWEMYAVDKSGYRSEVIAVEVDITSP